MHLLSLVTRCCSTSAIIKLDSFERWEISISRVGYFNSSTLAWSDAEIILVSRNVQTIHTNCRKKISRNWSNRWRNCKCFSSEMALSCLFCYLMPCSNSTSTNIQPWALLSPAISENVFSFFIATFSSGWIGDDGGGGGGGVEAAAWRPTVGQHFSARHTMLCIGCYAIRRMFFFAWI